MRNTATGAFDVYQPFIASAISVVKEVADINLSKKNLYIQYGKISIGGVGVSIPVSGEIKGQVVYEFSRDFTMRLSSRMLKEAQIVTSNVREYMLILESSLKELANMVSGNVLLNVQSVYSDAKIGTPEILWGKGAQLLDKGKKVVVVELTSPFGDFTININLKKQNHKRYYSR